MYYDCLATKIANLPFENSSTRCIPIQYHGLFESIGSNLSRCSTYNENLQIMNEISMQYLLPSMSNTYSFAYWIIQTSLVPYSTKNYSFILMKLSLLEIYSMLARYYLSTVFFNLETIKPSVWSKMVALWAKK